MSSPEYILKCDSISKSFSSGVIYRKVTEAVKNVSFTLKRGEIASLVGESGSGKSTISNLLLRLLKLSDGKIYLQNENIEEIGKKDYYRKVQVIFQDPYSSINYFYRIDRVLYKAFDLGSENKLSKGDKRQIITKTLKQVGLNADEILGRFPHQLSGGQLQRILIARILIINPLLLIADEPTSMIDASSRAGILNLLMKLRKEYGLTILFITHDIGQAQYISDSILVLNRGELVEQGERESVLTKPKHEYTKHLLSCVPSLEQKWILEEL